MSLLDFIGGTVPRAPYQLERDIEDAMEGANVRFDVGHNPDGTHKTFPTLDVTDDATIGGDLSVEGATAWTDHAGISLTANLHNAVQADGRPWDASVMRISADANRTITGIVPWTTAAFQMIKLLNVSGSGRTLTLAHDSSSSTSGYRFSCPGEVDFVLRDGSYVELLYDPSSDVWRVLGVAPVIKSIQAGTVTIAAGNNTSGTATITSVNTAKAFVIFNGNTGGYSSTQVGLTGHSVELTDATTVTARRGVADANSTASTVYFTVVEYT